MPLSLLLPVIAMIASATVAVFMLSDAGWRAREAGRTLGQAELAIADLRDRLGDLEWQGRLWDVLPVGVVVVGDDERARICNRRALAILQLAEWPRDRSLADVAAHPELLRCARQAPAQRHPVTSALTTAAGVRVDLIASALDRGGVLLVLVESRDGGIRAEGEEEG